MDLTGASKPGTPPGVSTTSFWDQSGITCRTGLDPPQPETSMFNWKKADQLLGKLRPGDVIEIYACASTPASDGEYHFNNYVDNAPGHLRCFVDCVEVDLLYSV